MQIVPNYPGRGNFTYRGLSSTIPGQCGVNNFSSLSFYSGIQARSSRGSLDASMSRATLTTMTTLFRVAMVESILQNRSPHMPATRASQSVRIHSHHLVHRLTIMEGGITVARRVSM